MRFSYLQIGDLSIVNRKFSSDRQIEVQHPEIRDHLSQYIFRGNANAIRTIGIG